MDTNGYVSILQLILLPFLQNVYPDGHRFMQDNDPTHTSKRALAFFEQHGVNWWKTPPESPDLNPIENLWQELKAFLKKEIKPHTKEELVEGIQQFWNGVTVEKCAHCIRQLRKVIPRVIAESGGATAS